ncbi:MAG: hypothetical protein KME18_18235 [Phormidium tanganyikae FI6-MK23]|jgi:hypothetical protein|nr:hypothetical protein [Phormidium tanganyikae FI6-MK23]
MSSATLNSVYSDELVSATELNRQPGQVLDRAFDRPITITRNDQSFALLRREVVAEFCITIKISKEILEVLFAALTLLTGQKIGTEHPYAWLSVFDQEELVEFVNEVLGVYRLTDSSEGTLDQIDAVIHEWHESAIAVASADLESAFSDKDEIDEIPLTKPVSERPE